MALDLAGHEDQMNSYPVGGNNHWILGAGNFLAQTLGTVLPEEGMAHDKRVLGTLVTVTPALQVSGIWDHMEETGNLLP